MLAAENAREIAAFKIQWWWIGLWRLRGSPVKRWEALQGEAFSPDIKDYSAEISKMVKADGRFSPSSSPVFEDFAGQLSAILAEVDFVEQGSDREQLDSIKFRFERQSSESASPTRRFPSVGEQAAGAEASSGSLDEASRERLGELNRLNAVLNPGLAAYVAPPQRLQHQASPESGLRYTRKGVVGKALPRSRHDHRGGSPEFATRETRGFLGDSAGGSRGD